MEIFKKRGAMTKFQILSEISKQEPHLKQKDLAERLGITVQAVSENIKSLIDDGYITSKDGRSPYKITQEGIKKVKRDAITLRKYSDSVLEIMNHYQSVWPAIARDEIKKGDTVGLYMEKGILYAGHKQQSASATALEDAEVGEDVALGELNGIIDLKNGQAIIVTLPTIKEGGSANADLNLIKNIYENGFQEWGDDSQIDKVAAIGTVSHAVANKLDIPIDLEFAVASSTASAARKGLNVMALSVGNMTKSFIRELESEDVKYNVIDGSK